MNLIALIVVAVLLLILVIMYFSYNNREVALRKEAEAQKGKIESVFDTMWKTIKQGVCTYSLLNKSWISEPYKGSYNFTPQQLWASYQYFETNIKQIADKISGTEKYLTLEGCEKLNNLLTNIKLETYAEKEQDILHEYSLKYNVYRLAQYFELFKKYENFIMISTQKDERKKHE